MEDIQQILQENAQLKAQILLNEEALLRKNELILYLQRQLFGRRSEKTLPNYCSIVIVRFRARHGYLGAGNFGYDNIDRRYKTKSRTTPYSFKPKISN